MKFVELWDFCLISLQFNNWCWFYGTCWGLWACSVTHMFYFVQMLFIYAEYSNLKACLIICKFKSVYYTSYFARRCLDLAQLCHALLHLTQQLCSASRAVCSEQVPRNVTRHIPGNVPCVQNRCCVTCRGYPVCAEHVLRHVIDHVPRDVP